MKRRDFLRAMGPGAAAIGLPRMIRAEQEAGRPNIVFIVTDDQRWNTLGC